MKKQLILIVAAVLVVLLPGCAKKASSPKSLPQPVAASPVASTIMTNQNAPTPSAKPGSNQPARLIVKWRIAPQSPEAVALRAKTATTSLQVFKGVGDGRMEVLLLPKDRESAEVIKEFENSGLVEYAEMDKQVKALDSNP
jgi:hypothetical protein